MNNPVSAHSDGSYIMALDAGTTSSRAILFDSSGAPAGSAQQEFPQIYPRSGWVEHDPVTIWDSQLKVAERLLRDNSVSAGLVNAIGIANQRETTILWNRHTGEPVFNALVWQDRRSAPLCEELKEKGYASLIREKTGLVIDAYFSATKISWILDNVGELRKAAEKGDILFGTVDTWLIWNLTGGRVHATDCTNASRTMLFNIHTLSWDRELLRLFDIPEALLPDVLPCSCGYGFTRDDLFDGASIPITGVAGDQQAALFGQGCFSEGAVKSTYGTGSFILLNSGEKPAVSDNGLITTVAWEIEGITTYAVEGSVFVTGAAVQWLRDEMGLIDSAEESETCALRVPDSGGVVAVPAFTGLGAPYWDMYARGALFGISRGTTLDHIVRAVLESLACQVRDVLDCMSTDSGVELKELRVDGGASANNFLMQFQADMLGVPVERPRVIESTARGAAFLAGLGIGVWNTLGEIRDMIECDRRFEPAMETKDREQLYLRWKRAVDRIRGWEQKQ